MSLFSRRTDPYIPDTALAGLETPCRKLTQAQTLADVVKEALKEGPTGLWSGRNDSTINDALGNRIQFQLGSHVQRGDIPTIIASGELSWRHPELTILPFQHPSVEGQPVPNKYGKYSPVFVLMGEMDRDAIQSDCIYREHKLPAKDLLNLVTYAALFIPEKDKQIPAWSKALVTLVDRCRLGDEIKDTRGGVFIQSLRDDINSNSGANLIKIARGFSS